MRTRSNPRQQHARAILLKPKLPGLITPGASVRVPLEMERVARTPGGLVPALMLEAIYGFMVGAILAMIVYPIA